tara:strand:- start:16562 stop:17326 length:765 start_codon:yes stop_codon:yes gene_type:complete
MLKRLSVLSLIILITLLTSCATDTGIERFKGMPAKKVFDGGEQSLVKEDYQDAIDHFEAIEAMYPYGEYAQQTQLNIIYAYYMDSEFDSAITSAERYIHLYPMGPNTDYAYYLKGVSEYSRNIGFFEKYLPIDRSPRDLSSWQLAFSDFMALSVRFPSSPYAADARRRMVYLRNMLGEHEMGIANYYYSRKAYIAAISRAQYVVTNLSKTPSVFPAFVMMVNSYKKLGLMPQAQRTLTVMAANYPFQTKKFLKK